MSAVAMVDKSTGEVLATVGLLDPNLGRLSATGCELAPGLSFDQWEAVGAQLRQAEKAVLWWIGDWLNYGERTYGETYAQAMDATDYSYQTLANAKYVAGRVELSRRRENVGWAAHAEVAALKPEQQERVLRWADTPRQGGPKKDERPSRRDVREFVNGMRRNIATDPPPLPQGKHSLIYCDPPWRYDYSKADSRRIENQYPTMDLEDICSLPVVDLAATDCTLFMWATSPKVAESIQVLDRWGFLYRTCAVWDKEVMGMGYYFRQQHELLLVATRGDPGVPEPGDRVSSVIRSRRGEHSAKPAEVYDLLESMYPQAMRVELFARAPRDGWSVWGNQVQGEVA